MPSSAQMTRRRFLGHAAAAVALSRLSTSHAAEPQPLAGTKPLNTEGDLAVQMVEGISKYLDAEWAAAPEKRKAFCKPDYSSVEAYNKSVEPNRERLRKVLGVVDERLKPVKMEIIFDGEPAAFDGRADAKLAVAKGDGYHVFAVRWPVFEGVDGEGLLLQPDKETKARVIAVPDADWTPEMLVGMAKGVPGEWQFGRKLAENGCQVVVPVLIDRRDTWSGNPKIRMTNQPHREFIYRMAFEMGRHIVGYEVQKVLAAVDWCKDQRPDVPVAVYGCGEGGLLGTCASALDTRVQSLVISGWFASGSTLGQEPIYRNLWSLSSIAGPGDLLRLHAPRPIIIERDDGPIIEGPPMPRAGRTGAAPGELRSTKQLDRRKAREEEFLVSREAYDKLTKKVSQWYYDFALDDLKDSSPRGHAIEAALLSSFGWDARKLAQGKPPTDLRKNFDPDVRLKRQFDQLVNFTQRLVRQADKRREEFFWAKTNTKSLDDWKQACEPLRKYFAEEVIGALPKPSVDPNPRTRLAYDEPKWKGYEVVLDVHKDVYAYGILLVPKDLKANEGRPVVVCQHGLEGRPQDVVNPKEKTRAYHSFGAQLADRGFVIFAPQNPYIGRDKFRVLQRKANPLKLSLFSFIVEQHRVILDWLVTLPFVDEKRIGFYGLSYGGKTGMRVPALLDRYCLSICSGDFNEWIWKNTSVDSKYSYMFTGEYEMFEFDLGNTFNYAEMSGLIAPRPFMVERGHDDGVAPDEWVAYEYAKVRRLYTKLKIPDRTAIEFFDGGHQINGQGTFDFLHKHLSWPKP